MIDTRLTNRDIGFALLLAALVLVLCLAACSKREIPAESSGPALRAWVPVTGASMAPNFPERGWVEVEIVDFDALQVGDTVLFWDYTAADGRLINIHHRLVARQGAAFIARGDNELTNPRADAPWVTRDNYRARTTGRWAYTLSTP